MADTALDDEWFPFGYEYEVLYPDVRRLFGFDDRLVLEVDHDHGFLVIEDLGVHADYHDQEFEDVMHEQVRIIQFATAELRDAYLGRYIAQRPWLEDRVRQARDRR